mgnify:CR=1 FL=1|tara:strand:+ start:2990 stop:3364 length:375 start_codon:yes stop_codon:yes gene_type:complete
MIRFNEYASLYDRLVEGTLDESTYEELSMAGRRSLARAAKRRKFQLARSRKKMSRRRADQSRINRRSQRQARTNLYKKLSGGKSKSKLSIAGKKNLERRAKAYKARLKVQSKMLRAPKRRADRR